MLAKYLLTISILCAPFVACAQSNLIQPGNVTLGPSQIQQFSVAGQAVAWYILPSGLGSISPVGLYTAPSSIPQTSTVFIYAVPKGTSQEYATHVTLTPQGSPVSFTISPASISLYAGQSKQFTAATSGADQNVAWSISPPTGSIANGLYVAPASVSSIVQVIVSATSLTNPADTATATLLLIPAIVAVTPASATLAQGQSQQFIALVRRAANSEVSWSLTPNLGSVSNGLYTAPLYIASPKTITLAATSKADPAKTAYALISLVPIGVTVTPSSLSLGGAASAVFSASVTGASDTAVSWSLNPAVGTVIDGVYTAPPIISTPQTITLTAASLADSTQTASATLVLIPVAINVMPASVTLGAGAAASVSAAVTGTANTAVSWSLSPALGIFAGGVYMAPVVIASPQMITLTATSLADSTKTSSLTINLTVPTPHFGNDGSELSTYVPGKSTFVRSMFFSLQNLPLYTSAFQAAQLNTLESGFYSPPGSGVGTSASDMLAWQSGFNGSPLVTQIEAAAQSGFNILLTGDDIARGDAAVYDATRGPSTLWPTDPITYAFTWAKNVGKVIGVEMVDEISSQYFVPFPSAQLGQPGGPQSISCIGDLCTVFWPSAVVNGNGAGTFIITGGTSNPNINNSVANIYHENGQFWTSFSGFTFNAPGIGTQTFTAATDPNLTFQMFAFAPDGPNATDYVHNDAIQDIMNDINAVPGGPPNFTWPAAASAPATNFAAWGADPRASNYADVYFAFLGNSDPTTYSLSDGLAAFNNAWNNKYPLAQPDKPTLMLVSTEGVGYTIAPVSLPVAAFDGTTITFAQPHGIGSPTVGLTRFSLSGNSNPALNGNYYVYNVVDLYTLQVYPANPTGPNVAGWPNAVVTFFDGQSVALTYPNAAYVEPTEIAMTGAPYCPNSDNFGQVATISNASYAPYQGQWYVLPVQFDNISTTTTCTWALKMVPLTAGQSGVGGTAFLIADDYYHPGVSTVNVPGVTADLVAANIMYAAEKGAAGVRLFEFGTDENQDQSLNSCFKNCGAEDKANPFYNGPDAQARWQGMSNAFNLIREIEPFLLQPQLAPPDYGPTMVTAARTSSYGILLMMTEFADSPQMVTISLAPYNPSGAPGTMYTMNGEGSTQQSVSGTELQVTFTPGETVAFTFPSAS